MKFDAPIFFAPGTLIGKRRDGRPIYLQAGGSADNEDFDTKMGDDEEIKEEEDDEEDGDGDDEEDEEGAEESKTKPVKKSEKKLTPEQEENARLKVRLAKTRRESAARRKKIDEMARAADTAKDGDDAEKAGREAKQAGFEEAENTYKPWVMDLFASNALLAAGIKPGKEKRALKLLDYEGIDFDASNRDISGIEDAVDELKEEWPELFGAEKEEESAPTSTPRVKSKDVNGAGRASNGSKKPKTSTELALDRLIGTGSR